jgi:endonuclease-3
MEKRVTIQERSIQVLNAVSSMYPHAHCELVHSNDLELLIAIALSAQTTDEAVNKTTQVLFSKYKSVEDYHEASIEDIQIIIRHLGLYQNKAKNLKAMIEMIRSQFDGHVPSTQEQLEQLPGVGRKTANVFLAVWHHVPRIAVDTHVDRVSKRLGLVKDSANVVEVEETLMKRYPKDTWIALHHQLLFFGRYHCTAKKPKCQTCPLLSICRKPQL